LFDAFAEAFREGFGVTCETIGPPEAVARDLSAFHPLAGGLLVLMGEWVSQTHYLEGRRERQQLDPLFTDMLRHHWMDEANHARMDTLLVEAYAAGLPRPEVARGIAEFENDVIGYFERGLVEQVELDLDALQRAAGRRLDAAEQRGFRREQLA